MRLLRPASVGLSAIVLVSVTPPSAGLAAPAVKDAAWVIILGGGDKDADAQAALDAWPRLAGGLVKPAAGFPKRVVSDTIKGLNPGFRIAVAGFCTDAKAAERVRDVLRLSAPGVYLRKVQGRFVDSCPKLAPAKAATIDKVTTFTKKRLDRHLTGVEWELAAAGPEISAGDEKLYQDLRLRIVAGKSLLSELVLTSTFTPDKDGSGALRHPRPAHLHPYHRGEPPGRLRDCAQYALRLLRRGGARARPVQALSRAPGHR